MIQTKMKNSQGYRGCNRAVKRVPVGVIYTNGLQSEGVWAIWSCR